MSERTVYCSKPRSSGQACGEPMRKVNERGVTVDKCPRDGSIFLDRGELPEIIRRVSTMEGYNPHRQSTHHRDSSDHGFGLGLGGGHHNRSSSDHHGHSRRSNDSFLAELFD